MSSIRPPVDPAAQPASGAAADAAAVLTVEELSVAFHGAQGLAPAVDGLSFTVSRGECLGIVGESGAGKSQAFLAALGLLSSPARVTGRVRLGGQELLGLPERALDRIRGARVGLVFQDPMSSLTPHLRIGDQLAEPLRRHLGMGAREARSRALQLLERVRLADAARRMRQYPHELSGGMRQRVMIAIALACDPQLLVLDEPTTALDVTLQAQILNLLAEFKRERGMALALITHDFGVVAGLADRVAVMRAGRLIEQGSAAQVLKAPRDPYTRQLLHALAGQSGEGMRASVPGGAALALSGVSVSFPVARGWRHLALRALDSIELTLGAGEALGVVGESGCGKSTLTRAALYLIRPGAGTVLWMGRSPAGLPAGELRRLRRELQIVFQDPLASLDPHLSVERLVAEPLEIHRADLDARGRLEEVCRMLERVGLDHTLLSRRPHELSGGQCQRVGIARAMILKPRVLVCDEPLSALDAPTQAQVLALLAELRREQGTSLLFVSHDLSSVRRLCDRVLVLYLGRMAELAPTRALFAAPQHPYTRELLAAIAVPDPDIQPARLAQVRLGEPPSPLDVPQGCAFRTRCPQATSLCAERMPAWQQSAGDRWVACHHWHGPADDMLLK
jgi:oligopeptide/dipeptide ABC transporter ATP-binding protein